jgi:hypothetical protein
LARHQSQKRGDVVKRSDGTAIRDHVVDDDKVATVTDIGLTAGKVGSVFVSTATQHGGPETTITSFHSRLLHQGIIVGVPYAFPGLTNMNEITGGSPYGAKRRWFSAA